MKLVIDDSINEELKDYLTEQLGITEASIDYNNTIPVLNVKYNDKTTPEIVMKYIELFQKRKYSILFGFDKDTLGDFNVLKYTVDDMCCEYCYRNLVMDLFENKKIKSVKSNFDFNMPHYNIEFIIEYAKDYKEKELIEYINEKYKL